MDKKIVVDLQDKDGRSHKTFVVTVTENTCLPDLLEWLRSNFPLVLEQDTEYSIFAELTEKKMPLMGTFSIPDMGNVIVRKRGQTVKFVESRYVPRLAGDITTDAPPPDIKKKRKN